MGLILGWWLKVLVAVTLSNTFKVSLGCVDGCEDDDMIWLLNVAVLVTVGTFFCSI